MLQVVDPLHEHSSHVDQLPLNNIRKADVVVALYPTGSPHRHAQADTQNHLCQGHLQSHSGLDENATDPSANAKGNSARCDCTYYFYT
ncbi:hypothetical protein V6N13_059833 [Hibiscus sabdariffa]